MYIQKIYRHELTVSTLFLIMALCKLALKRRKVPSSKITSPMQVTSLTTSAINTAKMLFNFSITDYYVHETINIPVELKKMSPSLVLA